MKFAAYRRGESRIFCAVDKGGAHRLPYSSWEELMTDTALSAQIESALSSPAEPALPCAPAADPGKKILCVGINYAEHIEETRDITPDYPVIFSKFSNALSASGDTVTPPACGKKMDYEAELVVVIGKTLRDATPEEAMECVFGYTCGNDLSLRDLQRQSSQWLIGKTPDGFAPVGPVIVTADEIDPSRLAISCRVNGETRQNSNTSKMIFPVPEILSFLSRIMTLEPGDIVFTGTPDGVVLGMPESGQVWLRPGDQIEVEIEGIGRLATTIG